MKLIVSTLIIVFSLTANLSLPVDTLAATPLEVSATSQSSPSANVNAFELFWPVTAGKTIDDTWYFLKTFKENLRAVIIFGSDQKADYYTLLATKRLLEADALIKSAQYELADKTLKLSEDKIKAANKEVASIQKNKFGPTIFEINNKLNNMNTYLVSIKQSSEKNQLNIDSLLKEINNFSQSIQP